MTDLLLHQLPKLTLGSNYGTRVHQLTKMTLRSSASGTSNMRLHGIVKLALMPTPVDSVADDGTMSVIW